MFGEIYKLQTENIRLQRELAQAQGDLARELLKHQACPCPCELEPAVLFKVTKRGPRPLYTRSSPWEILGYTNDLSVALRYYDTPGCAWVQVQRGFIDSHGRLYDAARNPVGRVP